MTVSFLKRISCVIIAFAVIMLSAPVFAFAAPNEPKAVWKILWLIVAEVSEPYDKMSSDEIAYAKQIVPYFEDFVESHTNGKLDLQITVKVSDVPIKLNTSTEEGNLRSGFNINEFQSYSLKDYDSYTVYAPYERDFHKGYIGVNTGLVSFIPTVTDRNGYSDKFISISAADSESDKLKKKKELLRGVYIAVHEWTHTLERTVPGYDEVPDTHNFNKVEGGSDFGYSYNDEVFRKFGRTDTYFAGTEFYTDTALYGSYDSVICQAAFVADYLRGTVHAEYSAYTRGKPYTEPGKTEFLKGIDAGWWQHLIPEDNTPSYADGIDIKWDLEVVGEAPPDSMNYAVYYARIDDKTGVLSDWTVAVVPRESIRDEGYGSYKILSPVRNSAYYVTVLPYTDLPTRQYGQFAPYAVFKVR